MTEPSSVSGSPGNQIPRVPGAFFWLWQEGCAPGWGWHCSLRCCRGKTRAGCGGKQQGRVRSSIPFHLPAGQSLGRNLLSCSLLLLPARPSLARQVFPAGLPTYPGHLFFVQTLWSHRGTFNKESFPRQERDPTAALTAGTGHLQRHSGEISPGRFPLETLTIISKGRLKSQWPGAAGGREQAGSYLGAGFPGSSLGGLFGHGAAAAGRDLRNKRNFFGESGASFLLSRCCLERAALGSGLLEEEKKEGSSPPSCVEPPTLLIKAVLGETSAARSAHLRVISRSAPLLPRFQMLLICAHLPREPACWGQGRLPRLHTCHLPGSYQAP